MFSAREHEIVNDQIMQWVQEGILGEVSFTPTFVSPLILVPKDNGVRFRLCVDFRLLNSICLQEFSPTLDRTALMRNLKKGQVFSTVDVSSAFLCIQLHSSLQTFFGIQFDNTYYTFRRLPFGFINSGHFFLRAMRYTISKIMPSLPDGSHVFVYVDDLLVVSTNNEFHEKTLLLLFHALEEDGWVINESKCCFFKNSVKFLGSVVGSFGMYPSPEVINKLEQLPLPKTFQELRSFFGLCNTLAPHNYKMYEILGPIRQFRKASAEAFASPVFLNVWESTIKELSENVWPLQFFDAKGTRPVLLFVDSSRLAHSACLFQGDSLIAMFSTANDKPYQSSGAAEIEGLLKSLRALRPFLLGFEVHVYTDNKQILDAMNCQNNSDFVSRRIDEIQVWFGRNLKLFHIPGAKNKLADFLSRNPSLIVDRRRGSGMAVNSTHVMWPEHWKFEEIKKAHGAHFGIAKTIQNLKDDGHVWKGMRQEVEAFITHCLECQKFKDLQPSDELGTNEAVRKCQLVVMDFIGPVKQTRGGFKYICTMIDGMSRLIQTRSFRKSDTQSSIRAVSEWVQCLGPIETLLVDAASYFRGSAFGDFCCQEGIKLKVAPSHSHKSVGLVEKANSNIINRLRRVLAERKGQWIDHLAFITDEINKTKHSITGFSPKELWDGTKRNGDKMSEDKVKKARILAVKRTREAQAKANDRLRGKLADHSFACGDLVWVFDNERAARLDRKLEPMWKGPGRIVEQISRSVWAVEMIDSAQFLPSVHSDFMRPYFAPVERI